MRARLLKTEIVFLVLLVGCAGQVGGVGDGAAADAHITGDSEPGDSPLLQDRGIDTGTAPDAAGHDPDKGGGTGCLTLGAWKATASFVGSGYVSHPLPSFASGGHYFVHTMKDGSERKLYSAKQQPGGGLSAWQLASPDHGGGPHGFTAIDVDGEPYHFRNGHIARYPIAGGVMQGDVVLEEESVSTSFGGNKYVWDSAVFVKLSGGQRFVYHLGGFSFAGYTYKHDVYRSGVPVQSTFVKTGLSHPGQRPGKAASFAPAGKGIGFIFTGEAQGAKLWRAKVHASGQLDPFVALQDLPQGSGNGRGDLLVKGSTLFAIRGAKVFRATLSDAGALSSWLTAPDLPEEQVNITWGDGHLEGNGSGIIGDTLYVTGPDKVYYAPFVPTSACGP